MESSCNTLFMCIITTLKEGVRAGGGISDVLRKPHSQVYMYAALTVHTNSSGSV